MRQDVLCVVPVSRGRAAFVHRYRRRRRRGVATFPAPSTGGVAAPPRPRGRKPTRAIAGPKGRVLNRNPATVKNKAKLSCITQKKCQRVQEAKSGPGGDCSGGRVRKSCGVDKEQEPTCAKPVMYNNNKMRAAARDASDGAAATLSRRPRRGANRTRPTAPPRLGAAARDAVRRRCLKNKCNCPDGQVLDDSDSCIPADECPKEMGWEPN